MLCEGNESMTKFVFIFRFGDDLLLVISVTLSRISKSVSNTERAIGTNGLGLGEVGELEVQMFNKPQMLIEVQMFNLALLPPFCQTPVMCCPSRSLFFLCPLFLKIL